MPDISRTPDANVGETGSATQTTSGSQDTQQIQQMLESSPRDAVIPDAATAGATTSFETEPLVLPEFTHARLFTDADMKRMKAPRTSDPEGPGRPTGWALMQDRMYKFDEASMKYLSDDIDTLLVFVGVNLLV